jgi:rhamnogalacturonan endolyase
MLWIGELRWVTRLSRTAFGNGISAADILGGTAIEGSDVFLVNGLTRSKFYSSKRFVEDQIHGITGLAGAAYIVIACFLLIFIGSSC